jgi:hypothetical protein
LRPLSAVLLVSLTGCSAVTVYLPEAPPSARCAIVAPVKSSLTNPAGSPEHGAPLAELRTRVLDSCKEAARDAGANALLVTERTETESAGGKALGCSGMAYICP